MTPQKCKKIFERFAQQNAAPITELIYHSSFELLIAVILSARATDVSVNKATRMLFNVASTPQTMLKLGEEKLNTYIKSIGLYKTKGKNILKTCEILIHQHHSQVPDTRDALEALPGVGRKTANVLLNTLFGHPTVAVDTHIFRVSNRTSLAPGKTPRAVEQKLLDVIPPAYLHRAHHWLVLHGRYVCVARKPHCPTCLIRDLCEYKHKTV